MRGQGNLADMVPLLDVTQDGFITTSGRLGRIIRSTGLNITLRGTDGAEAVSAEFADMLSYLREGDHLQMTVINTPSRADEWIAHHLEQFRDCPQGFEWYLEARERWLRRKLAGSEIPHIEFYAVCTVPAPKRVNSPRKRLFPRRERTLAFDEADYNRQLARLNRFCDHVELSLSALGLSTQPLPKQATLDLVWSCLCPHTSRSVAAPQADPPPYDTRSLRERLAQKQLRASTDYIRLDGRPPGWETTLSLRRTPATFAGWLDDLITAGFPFRLALHIEGEDPYRQRHRLERRLTRREGAIQLRQSKGFNADVPQLLAAEEERALIADLASGELRSFRGALYVNVRANTSEELDDYSERLARVLRNTGGDAIDDCQRWQLPAWQATLPLGEHGAGHPMHTITPNIADLFPFLSHMAGTEGGPLLGVSLPGYEAATLDMLSPDLPNGNLNLTGMSGSGKTLVQQQLSAAYVAMGLKVIAIERSAEHFRDLVRATPGGRYYNARLDSGLSINPWDLPHGTTRPTGAKVDYLITMHRVMFATNAQATHVEIDDTLASVLERAIRAVYSRHSRPLERNLYEYLEAHGGEMERALATRIEPFVYEGRFASFTDRHTTLDPEAPIQVFNLREMDDSTSALILLPLFEYITSTVRGRRGGSGSVLNMDECSFLLGNSHAAAFVANQVRTGRHDGLITINASQQIEDYLSDFGRTVIANSAATLILTQNQHTLPALQQAFRLDDDEMEKVAKLKKKNRLSSHAYFRADGAASGLVSIEVSPEEYWLYTSEPHKEKPLRERTIAKYNGDVVAAIAELAATDGNPELADDSRDQPALAGSRPVMVE